jgi:hypothetical protein
MAPSFVYPGESSILLSGTFVRPHRLRHTGSYATRALYLAPRGPLDPLPQLLHLQSLSVLRTLPFEFNSGQPFFQYELQRTF